MTFGELPREALFRFRPNAPLYQKIGQLSARSVDLNLPTTVSPTTEIIALTDQTEDGTV